MEKIQHVWICMFDFVDLHSFCLNRLFKIYMMSKTHIVSLESIFN